MSDKHLVDANVLMYFHDSAAGEKRARAKAHVRELWDGATTAGSSVRASHILKCYVRNPNRDHRRSPLDERDLRSRRDRADDRSVSGATTPTSSHHRESRSRHVQAARIAEGRARAH